MRTSIATFITFAFSAIAAAYFLDRYLRHGRRFTSLALVPMCLGWFVAAALMNGEIEPRHYDVVQWVCATVSLLMFAAIVSVELREMPGRT